MRNNCLRIVYKILFFVYNDIVHSKLRMDGWCWDAPVFFSGENKNENT